MGDVWTAPLPTQPYTVPGGPSGVAGLFNPQSRFPAFLPDGNKASVCAAPAASAATEAAMAAWQIHCLVNI